MKFVGKDLTELKTNDILVFDGKLYQILTGYVANNAHAFMVKPLSFKARRKFKLKVGKPEVLTIPNPPRTNQYLTLEI